MKTNPIITSDVSTADWRPMRKGVADLHRRAEVIRQANEGLRNGDLRRQLNGESLPPAATRRAAAQVTRRLALQRAHGLLRKVPKTHRDLLTDRGRQIIIALQTAPAARLDEFLKSAD